jgi:1-acyl-sn-glycerol-3-phosphate acyltransferase
MVYTLGKIFVWRPFRRFIRKIKGLENVPKDKGFIIAANHCSYIDHLMITGLFIPYLDKKVQFLAKKEHFHQGWFQNWWHNWTCSIPIDRKAGGKKALKTAIKCLKKGGIIAIYPEGTRSTTGKIQRGKSGVARLALAAKVPVLPIGLIGTIKILPRGVLMPKFKRADMNIGKLMYFDKYYGKEDDYDSIRKVTDDIMNEIARLSKQKYRF